MSKVDLAVWHRPARAVCEVLMTKFSSKRPKGGLGTSRGHPVPPPRGFGPVRGGHRGRRDGPQHEAPFLVMTTAGKGLIAFYDSWGTSDAIPSVRRRLFKFTVPPSTCSNGSQSHSHLVFLFSPTLLGG